MSGKIPSCCNGMMPSESALEGMATPFVFLSRFFLLLAVFSAILAGVSIYQDKGVDTTRKDNVVRAAKSKQGIEGWM
jgi:hypothetical protein